MEEGYLRQGINCQVEKRELNAKTELLVMQVVNFIDDRGQSTGHATAVERS